MLNLWVTCKIFLLPGAPFGAPAYNSDKSVWGDEDCQLSDPLNGVSSGVTPFALIAVSQLKPFSLECIQFNGRTLGKQSWEVQV